jgi:photosystem II stability/assembly factor-like uncharacterized protein/DNA-binding beta-propeller fold protein YncE
MMHASRNPRWTRCSIGALSGLIILILAACVAPPPIAPTPAPSRPPPLTPATLIPDQLLPEPSLLPAVERALDLGARGMTDPWQLPHPIALDEANQRLYVSVSASRTVVLDADSLVPIGDVDAGGSVAVLPERDKLYIGTPGVYGGDGRIIAPPALRLYDASTLAFRRTILFSDTYSLTPLALPDAVTGQVYLVHAGVYVADADTLEVSGTFSGTLPEPGALGYSLYAIDAALDPARRRLFVSLNNGIPGSNNGNVLRVFNLDNGRIVAEDFERSVINLDIDPASGAAYVPRAHLAGAALVKYDAQGRALKRLDNAVGRVQVDPAHDRVYLLNSYPPRLIVLDRQLNYHGEVRLPADPDVIGFAVDAGRDRLYLLDGRGHLQVLNGHTRAITDQPPPPAPPRGRVQWLAASPDFARDRLIFAAFAADEYGSGSGTLFANRDDGATWEFVSGLPITNAAAALAFSSNFANDKTLFVALLGSGLYRSADGGATWQPTSIGLSDLAIQQLAVSPDFEHDHIVYAAGARRGLFRSTDGGLTWLELADGYLDRLSGDTYPALSALALSPAFARDGRLLISRAAISGGTYLSRDRGETWIKVLPDSVSRLAFLADARTVYAALGSGGVLRSDDGGEHWQAASDGLELLPGSMTDLLTGPDYALAWLAVYGQPSRAYLRPVKDLPWYAVGSPDQPMGSTFALASDGSLFTGFSTGELRRYYVDNLSGALPPERHIADLTIQSIAIARDTANEVYVGGGAFGVWASRDLDNWFDLQFPDRHSVNPMQLVVSPDFARDQTIFATTGQGLYRSRGRPWKWAVLPIGSGADPIGGLAISPNFAADRTVLIAGDYRQPGLRASLDGGDSWADIRSPGPITESIGLKPFLTSDGSWWAWIDYRGLYRTADRGQTWTQLIDDQNAVAQAIAVSPDYARDGTIWISLLYGGIYRTSDAGRTWVLTPPNWPAPSIWPRALVFSPDFAADRLVFAGTDDGLYRSSDAGASWARADDGLLRTDAGTVPITALAISPAFAQDRTLLAASAGGLWISRDGAQSWTRIAH